MWVIHLESSRVLVSPWSLAQAMQAKFQAQADKALAEALVRAT